jgi:hypothetical protein
MLDISTKIDNLLSVQKAYVHGIHNGKVPNTSRAVYLINLQSKYKRSGNLNSWLASDEDVRRPRF